MWCGTRVCCWLAESEPSSHSRWLPLCGAGPTTDAVPFFQSLGFACPTRKDVPSFLLEVTTPKGACVLEKLQCPSAMCVGVPCNLSSCVCPSSSLSLSFPQPLQARLCMLTRPCA